MKLATNKVKRARRDLSSVRTRDDAIRSRRPGRDRPRVQRPRPASEPTEAKSDKPAEKTAEATPRRAGAPTSADPLALYLRKTSGVALLRGEEEVEVARRIEDSER